MHCMDLQEQNNFAVELEKFVLKRLKGKPFYLVVSVESTPGNGFTVPILALDKRTPFESCDIVIGGVIGETKILTNRFDFPSNTKVKRPVELM